MRQPFKVEVIRSDDPEGVQRAFAFANSFDHAIFTDHFPVFLLCRGDKPVAYWQELRLIIARPSWHSDPKICSKRDVLEGSRLVTRLLQEKYGASIISTPDPSQTFSDGIMLHLGYEPMNMRLFLATERIH